MKKETKLMLDKIQETERRMDEKCHDLFLNKEILAPILRETVEEYQGLTIEEIISLIDEASISKLEAVNDFPKEKDVRIEQIDTEMKSVTDKRVLFDIHFKAALPKEQQNKLNFQLYIDFEPQGIYDPSYPLIKRGIYYAARSLSRQLGELTEETNYGKLQKVYSIWLCYDPKMPKKIKNTVSRYKIKREDLYGEVDEAFNYHDLLEVVIARVDTLKESKIDLFDYLKGIFTNDREKIMKHTGELPEKVMKEVDIMSGVGALIRQTALDEGWSKGMDEGWSKGLNEGWLRGRIETLYCDAGYTIEKISEKLDMEEEEVKNVLESLQVIEK